MKNTLDMIQSNPHTITEELLASLAEPLNTAEQKAKAAFDAYHEDLKVRHNKLVQQDAEYTVQVTKLKSDRAKLAALINDFSSRGEIERAAETDIQIEAVDKEITAVERKKRIISTTEIKGDCQLYQAAKAALDGYNQTYKSYLEHARQVKAAAEAERDHLNNIVKAMEDRMSYHSMYVTREMEKAFEKVDRHFRDIDRIEREAAEEHKRKEIEAATRRKVRIIAPPEG